MSVVWWTDEQKELLKQFFPKTDKKEILKVLKDKTWYSIKKEADRLQLKREIQTIGRPKKKPKQFLGKKQLTELLKKDITIGEIAIKLKTEPHIVRKFIKKYSL